MALLNSSNTVYIIVFAGSFAFGQSVAHYVASLHLAAIASVLYIFLSSVKILPIEEIKTEACNLKPAVDFLKKNLRQSLQLFSIGILALLALTADKIYQVYAAFPTELMGLYQQSESIALIYYKGITVLTFLFVPLVLRIGRKRALPAMWLLFSAAILAAGAAVFYWLSQSIIKNLAPSYVGSLQFLAGVVAIKGLCLAQFLPTYFLVAVNKYLSIATCYLFSAALTVVVVGWYKIFESSIHLPIFIGITLNASAFILLSVVGIVSDRPD